MSLGRSSLAFHSRFTVCPTPTHHHPAPAHLAAVLAQVSFYRKMVKCPLCKDNEKNAMIIKCGHTFCRHCIDDRLSNRNRKCPTCGLQFDYQGVKEMFLTN